MNTQLKRSYPLNSLIKPTATVLLVGAIFVVMLLAITLGSSLGVATSAQSVTSLFGMDSTQLWWYVTRAAGLTGYFLIWLSMVWGFAISTKLVHPLVEGTFIYDFHEHLSLLGLGFILVHIVVLLFDKFLPFSIAQLLIPFVDSYRPLWVGIGIISLYVLVLVTVTFYLRSQIGTQAFRSIHVLSIFGYLGATLHGLFAGTDSSLPITMILYAGTFLAVVFLTVYWLVMRRPEKKVEVPMRPTQYRHAHRR
jgi:sulfoxide reductase heme-binding subunit YedZ